MEVEDQRSHGDEPSRKSDRLVDGWRTWNEVRTAARDRAACRLMNHLGRSEQDKSKPGFSQKMYIASFISDF